MNEINPLISVIVPIYNVEKYVRKCLDSLKNQTMKQIEVICIDDGSTDESGRIAEEYKNEEGWPRFRIIHTENRGLSAARNRGLDEARAGWIMFVDSDDWVEQGFCEIPYRVAIKNNVDLVIFENDCWEKGKVKYKKRKRKEKRDGFIDELIAHEIGSTVAWNKLYCSALFKTIRYPIGKVYEESSTTHKLVHIAKSIYKLRNCLYHYRLREGSITHTYSLSNKRDALIAAEERKKDLISYGYPKDKLKNVTCGHAIGYLAVTLPNDDETYLLAQNIVNSCRCIPKGLTWKKKIGLLAWKINPRLFYHISRTTNRIKSEKKNAISL